MIFARHVSDGSLVLEAFEYSIPLPFVRTSQAVWRPVALTGDALEANYVDIRDNVEQCNWMIGEAYEVARFILKSLKLDASDIENLSLRMIHARMMSKLGTIDVTQDMIRKGSAIGGDMRSESSIEDDVENEFKHTMN